jgi:hypothetical protein
MPHAMTMKWQGGEHPFLLRIGELRVLDDRLTDGAMAAFARLRVLRPKFNDVYEVVRQGLIGGGMPDREASALVAMLEEQHGIGPMVPLAQSILFQAFYRREETEEPGEMSRPEKAQNPVG